MGDPGPLEERACACYDMSREVLQKSTGRRTTKRTHAHDWEAGYLEPSCFVTPPFRLLLPLNPSIPDAAGASPLATPDAPASPPAWLRPVIPVLRNLAREAPSRRARKRSAWHVMNQQLASRVPGRSDAVPLAEPLSPSPTLVGVGLPSRALIDLSRLIDSSLYSPFFPLRARFRKAAVAQAWLDSPDVALLDDLRGRARLRRSSARGCFFAFLGCFARRSDCLGPPSMLDSAAARVPDALRRWLPDRAPGPRHLPLCTQPRHAP